MTAEIRLYSSQDVGFDLDTMRPLFQSTDSMRAWVESTVPRFSYDSANWQQVGDPMILPVYLNNTLDIDIGVVYHDFRYLWFRVTDVQVLGNRTCRISYDIDHLASFPEAVGPGRITAIPHDDRRALAPSVVPRWWNVTNTYQLDGEPWAAVILTQMKVAGTVRQGPFYLMLKPSWSVSASGSNPNPVQSLVDAEICAASDVVQSWAVPGFPVFNDTSGETGTNWDRWVTWLEDVPGIELMRWTDNSLLTSVETQVDIGIWDGISTGVELVPVNPYVGRQLGLCDDRGVILWTMPYPRLFYSSIHIGLRMSFANCELDISFVDSVGELDDELITLQSHVTDRMVTFSCRPLDAVVDAWQDYLFRQREADIENRRIQNESNLVGGVAGIATGAATGALVGSVVPGIGTAVGAVAGAVTGIATTVTGYGVGTHYGAQEQGVTDRIYRLAQDGVSVGGMISSHGMEHGFLHLFAMRTDVTTRDSVQAMADLRGFPCDSWSRDIRSEMASLITADGWTPFAAECEVIQPMPVTWRRSLQQTLASGARYRKFGVWS